MGMDSAAHRQIAQGESSLGTSNPTKGPRADRCVALTVAINCSSGSPGHQTWRKIWMALMRRGGDGKKTPPSQARADSDVESLEKYVGQAQGHPQAGPHLCRLYY